MPKHNDYQKMYDEMIKQYGKDEGEKIYYAYLNKHNLDDTKPMKEEFGYNGFKRLLSNDVRGKTVSKMINIMDVPEQLGNVRIGDKLIDKDDKVYVVVESYSERLNKLEAVMKGDIVIKRSDMNDFIRAMDGIVGLPDNLRKAYQKMIQNGEIVR
jgi:hypothetical protein